MWAAVSRIRAVRPPECNRHLCRFVHQQSEYLCVHAQIDERESSVVEAHIDLAFAEEEAVKREGSASVEGKDGLWISLLSIEV